MNAETPVKSYEHENRELIKAYEHYLTARGNTAPTIRAYLDTVRRLADAIGSQSLIDLDRSTIHGLFAQWIDKGIAANSIRLHTCALRNFYKFVRLAGLTNHDPMLLIAPRKIPSRLPVVLTAEQVDKIIAAAQNPFERAVPEVLYSTGVRVSELVKLRIEDINWASGSICVRKGKGGKDRVVFFGSKAEEAMRAYLERQPSQSGFLFESPAQRGCLMRGLSWGLESWFGMVRVNGFTNRKTIRIGSRTELSEQEARRELDRITAKIPGFRSTPARPYSPMHIRKTLSRLGLRAGIPHVHPHALRRAMASHMLQDGANIRAVQDLLGHELLTTTMRYTWLDATHIKKVHEKFHPYEEGDNGKKK